MDGKIEEEKSNYARETRDKQWRRYGTETRARSSSPFMTVKLLITVLYAGTLLL